MTIAQLLKMPVGTRIGGGFVLTIKTARKKTQVKNNWIHTVTLFDETGEMEADVNIKTYAPLIRSQEIKIIVAEIQQTRDGIKLYVDQFAPVVEVAEPPMSGFEIQQADAAQVVRSKIKCLFLMGKFQSGKSDAEVLKSSKSKILEEIIDETVKG